MESIENQKNNVISESAMDMKAVIKRIIEGRNTIYRSMAVAFILAVLIVIITPRKYNTEIVLLSETQAKNGASGLLGQLGGMTGMNLGDLVGLNMGGSSGSDVLSPDVYPDIVKSTPFLMDVMANTITESKHHKSMTVSSYLKTNSNPSIMGLVGRFFKLFSRSEAVNPEERGASDAVLHLSQEQTDQLEALGDMIQIDVQKSSDKLMGGRSKVLTVNVEAHDPLVSALLADSVVSCLKRYVVDYNTRKAKKDLNFVMVQLSKARENYHLTQKKLADFNDSHMNVVLASVNSEREQLQRDYNLSTNIYTSLAQLMEKSKIQVQERTPVFTIIEPAKVPLKKSAPRSSLIILGMLFVGAFVGLSIVLVKMMLNTSS